MTSYTMCVDLPYGKSITQYFKAWPKRVREVAERIARECGGRVAWHTLTAC